MKSIFFVTADQLGPMRTALYRFLELKLSNLADWDGVKVDCLTLDDDRARIEISFWTAQAAREFEAFSGNLGSGLLRAPRPAIPDRSFAPKGSDGADRCQGKAFRADMRWPHRASGDVAAAKTAIGGASHGGELI